MPQCQKLKKRPFRLIKRFYKPKTSKKCKEYPLIEVKNVREKSRIAPKKTQRGTLWSRLYFWKHKKIVVRESNPRSPASQTPEN